MFAVSEPISVCLQAWKAGLVIFRRVVCLWGFLMGFGGRGVYGFDFAWVCGFVLFCFLKGGSYA